MANGTILVTGGAGYIGSHVVRQLGEAGEPIVVLDNLGKGFRQAVTAGELIVGDVGDYPLVSRLLAEHRVDTVMHFAAHTIVPESVALPLKYYGNNTCKLASKTTSSTSCSLHPPPSMECCKRVTRTSNRRPTPSTPTAPPSS
jgi:UDP-glucose 4-epimerase